MLLLLVVTEVTVWEPENVVRKELASLAVNWTSTSPRHRLRNTSAALTRRNISSTTGTRTMPASTSSGLIGLLWREARA